MGTIKKIFSLFFFLQAFTSQSFLFSQVSAKDQVTHTVQCRDEIGQSYALDRKSTRLNSSHANIYSLSLHDALPISSVFHVSIIPVLAGICQRSGYSYSPMP